jgi:hypothetical protein
MCGGQGHDSNHGIVAVESMTVLFQVLEVRSLTGAAVLLPEGSFSDRNRGQVVVTQGN